MRIIFIIISFLLIAEAGIGFTPDKQNQPLVVFAFEGAAEEEPPPEIDNAGPDTQYTDNYIYINNLYSLKQNYLVALKYNLPFISHTIFSPPPNV